MGIKNLLPGIAASFLLFGASTASAVTYSYSTTDPHVGGTTTSFANSIQEIRTSYDTATQILNWTTQYEAHVSNLVNGSWLVVSDGPNPKGIVNELAIFYADFVNNRVSVYQYNGQNSTASWSFQDRFIASFDNALTISTNSVNRKTVEMEIDVSAINAFLADPEWKGAQYGPELGAWFHSLAFKDPNGATYDQAGRITSWDLRYQNWFDRRDLLTYSCVDCQSVPAPAPLGLLAFGLLGLGILRRRHVR